MLKPELALNLEAVVRTTLFDRMLTLNLTGFYETFTDFQAQTYSALLTSFQLTNAGKLITQGAEVEAVLRPVDGLSLSGNLAYTRSEEHTSELQSLMRISYAVFCLKKKKKRQTHQAST